MIKASEYCAKIFDGTHDTPKPTQDGEYLVTSKCLLDGKIDFSSAYKISKEDYNEVNRRSQVSQYDILFSMIGTIGNTYLEESSDINYAIKNIGVFSCRNREKAIFLYYYLQSPYAKKYIERGLDGAVQKFLSLEKMRNFPVPEFSESAYKAISELRRIDDKISTNNKIIETSEKLMREIYDYWFVQFDFPDENGCPYKSSGGEMVYDETLKRKIPKGWKARNILDVADWVGGAQPPKSTFIYEPRNGYVRFIQNRDYADDNYKTWIPESKSNKICDRLDIMMDKYGDAGRIRFGLAGAYNVALAKIAIEKENLREYIRGFLSSEAIYQYLYNACMASTRASLNEEILGNLNLAMPSEEILNQYQTIAEQNIQLILTLSDENKQLASLRDWLLPMLMNGQIKVSD